MSSRPFAVLLHRQSTKSLASNWRRKTRRSTSLQALTSFATLVKSSRHGVPVSPHSAVSVSLTAQAATSHAYGSHVARKNTLNISKHLETLNTRAVSHSSPTISWLMLYHRFSMLECDKLCLCSEMSSQGPVPSKPWHEASSTATTCLPMSTLLSPGFFKFLQTESWLQILVKLVHYDTRETETSLWLVHADVMPENPQKNKAPKPCDSTEQKKNATHSCHSGLQKATFLRIVRRVSAIPLVPSPSCKGWREQVQKPTKSFKIHWKNLHRIMINHSYMHW